jgi:hypothetical protein
MGKKKTFYLPDNVHKMLDDFGQESNLSRFASMIFERYQAITEAATPELTLGEWLTVCDALVGCEINGSRDPAAMVWAEVAEYDTSLSQQHHGVKSYDLAMKIRGLTLAGRIAVWDVVARFWNISHLGGNSTKDILIRCGAKIKEE